SDGLWPRSGSACLAPGIGRVYPEFASQTKTAARRPPSRYCEMPADLQGFDRVDQLRQALLCIGEIHARLGVDVERVVDAGIASAHRSLENDDRAGLVHVQDWHSVD